MNKEQKAAVVEEVAAQIEGAGAVLAVDYRGLSVTQAVELRQRLGEADATFRVVKNRLTSRAVDKAGAGTLKGLLEGPTAFAFARGDAALAAKALSTFRREHGVLAFKGGTMEGEPLSVEEIESIARLPGREALQAHLVGVLAAPIGGLARGLGSLIQGLAAQLEQVREQGLLGGEEAVFSPAAADEGTGGAQADTGGGSPPGEAADASAEQSSASDEAKED